MLPDPGWLWQNLKASWARRASGRDFARQMLLRYAHRLPRSTQRREWTIGFRQPPPVGAIRLRLRDNVGSDLFIYSEVFEHEYYRLPLTQVPETILDLGANIGLSLVYFARSFPAARLACVEPVAENLEVLRSNLAMNRIKANVFPAAVDVVDGAVMMERDDSDYGHKIAAAPAASVLGHFEVAAVSVPSILRSLGWSRIGLLKIDIEGHETRLFAAACDWLHLVDAMCIEYHQEGGKEHLTRLAAEFGFLPPRPLPGAIWFLTRYG
jgi:FkbM family methyltransferase